MQCTESVYFSGQMAESILAGLTKGRRMVRAPTCGRMDIVMLENLKTMSAMAAAFYTMLMAKNSMAYGKREKSMVDVITDGLMERNISFRTPMARKQPQDVSNQMESQLKTLKTNTLLSPKKHTKG